MKVVGSLALLLLVLLLPSALAQTFQDVNAALTGMTNTALCWGDYDNDGDLDLVITGGNYDGIYTYLYRNDNGAFTKIDPHIVGTQSGAIAWGDYDNDGDLDLAIAGGTSGYITRIYRNDNGVLTDIKAVLLGTYGGALAWGDYDNDGDLDLAVTGETAGSRVTIIYRNDGGRFTDIKAALVGIGSSGDLAWCDYDNDGDLDLIVSGRTGSSGTAYITKLYRNDAGVFVDSHASIASCGETSLDWGDYDKDGDLDLVITGWNGTVFLSVYRNDNGSFVKLNTSLPGVYGGIAKWGDYDNDGYLDIAVTGLNYDTPYTKLYHNNGNGTFSTTTSSLMNLTGSNLAWGDYNGDGKLDLALFGYLPDWQYFAKLYRNDNPTANTTPTEPRSLSATSTGQNVTFSWGPGIDVESGQNGLSYNLRVGTTPGSGNVLGGMANLTTGLRKLPAIGNVQKRLSWTLKGLAPGTYYWSVQSIDSAFAGSAWAAEQSVTVGGCSVTGYVKTSAGTPLKGVLLTTDNGGGSAATNANGYYVLGVPSGWSGTVTPSAAGCTISPATTSYSTVTSNQSQDYSWWMPFSETGINLAGVSSPSAAWGDYDRDGDLDLIVMGWYGTGSNRTPMTRLYRNDNGAFNTVSTSIPNFAYGALAWGDYDNDGDLDLLISGQGPGVVTRVYRNTSGTFTDINAGLADISAGSVAWGDYDNDGDLDIVVMGNPLGALDYTTKIYRNDGNGVFTDIHSAVQGCAGTAAWGDYDNDGDLDLAISGENWNANPIFFTKIYRNDGGTFTDINAGLLGKRFTSIAWGDLDNDGDLDLAVAGVALSSDPALESVSVYRNDSGVFTDIHAGLAGGEGGSVAWGDYDNDGYQDLAVASMCISKVYHNNRNGTFTDAYVPLPQVCQSSISWGDFDKDGDLDLAIFGDTLDGLVGTIFRNESLTANTVPVPPSALSVSSVSGGALFQWNAGTDAQTPQSGLSYNIRVGTTSGANNVFSGMANSTSGFRLLPAIGNAQKKLAWTLHGLQNRAYYWSVQSIDSAFGGSPWSPEQLISFGVGTTKSGRNGDAAMCSAAIVSAVFADCFYIEADDRSSGVRVEKLAYAPTLGSRLDVVGTIRTNANGERYIEAGTVADAGTGSVAPMTLTNKALGGGPMAFDPLTGAGQRGVEDGSGLNNIGLLVKTTGRVTAVAGDYFYIDDGTHATDFSIFVGVRVHCGGLSKPAFGQFATVTGISSIYNVGGRYFRGIRPRSQADITITP